MSVDTRDPFRLDLDFEPTSSIRDVILTMEPLSSLLELYVHGIAQGGERTVSAHVGDHVVLYRTVVTPKKHAELLVRVDEYNADPAAGWEKLRTRLAAEHLGMLSGVLLAVPSTFVLLHFEELRTFDTPPPAARVIHVQRPPSIVQSAHSVTMPLPGVLGTTRLYVGDDDPTEEVTRFNRDPEAAFAILWAAAKTKRVEHRRAELEALAAEQVRDIRNIEKSLRIGRANG